MNYSPDDSRDNRDLGKTGQPETQRRDPIAKGPEGLDANHKITGDRSTINKVDHKPVHIRWMIRRDYSDVLAIDAASFSHAMVESELMNILRQKNSIGIVAESESSEKILGFAIYDLEKDLIDIVRFAVHPEHRRQGIGTALLDKLISKLNPLRRCFLRQTVSEDNLNGQLFLKARGLKAESISRNEFIDPYSGDGLDGYVFKYSVR